MVKKLPKAFLESELKIGEDPVLIIPCAVLEDGTRLVSERGVSKALGGKRGGSHWKRMKKSDGAYLPVFASATNIIPFINKDLAVALSIPIRHSPKRGGHANGIDAKLLPEVCNVWLKARDAGALHPSQEHIAEKADILVRGFATVGIIALIDEATGYQDIRVKDSLAKILEEFIAKEKRPYIGTFPVEFYREIFRLNRWPWHEDSTKRPGVIAHWTNDLVYERLAPGVLDELKKRNPTYKPGQRRFKLFQNLSEEIGEPKLKSHFDGLLALARAAPNWRKFKELVNRAYPKKWEQLLLDFDDDAEK